MNLKKIISYILKQIDEPPQAVVILGSGLGSFSNRLQNKKMIPYADIPEYPQSTVRGHAGEWVFGYVNSNPVICASGRFHYYEGFTIEQVILPVTVSNGLGCKTVFITNAAGCLEKNWQLGDLMLISGYLDYSFRQNSNQASIVPFDTDSPPMQSVRDTASEMGITLREGIYTWTLGPSYETPAEIQDIHNLGGNAVGMSTVPELMKARELGLEVIGISCLTNYGAGMDGTKLSHADVLETTSRVQKEFSRLLCGIV